MIGEVRNQSTLNISLKKKTNKFIIHSRNYSLEVQKIVFIHDDSVNVELLDICGICYGPGVLDGTCDCYGNIANCAGECPTIPDPDNLGEWISNPEWEPISGADVDGDGDMDVLSTSDGDDTIAWYENDGAANPTWTAVDITTSADGASSVFAADMDGDGDMDILSASVNDNTIAWYENDGSESFTEQDPGYKSINWDATNDYGKLVSAGMYLYQIQAGEYISTKKMVLLK